MNRLRPIRPALLAVVFLVTAVFPLFGAQPLPPLTVMARSGSSGLLTIDPRIAVNCEGMIVFTGTDPGGSGVFVVSKSGTEAPKILQLVATPRDRFCAGVGISSEPDPVVVYRDHLLGGSFHDYILRKKKVSDANALFLGVVLGDSVPDAFNAADWDSITSFSVDVNSAGTAVVQGLVSGSSSTALFIGGSRPMKQLATYSGSVVLHPQISDTGRVVIRDNTGRIITFAAVGDPVVVAGSSKGFDLSTTGNEPGISTDGTAIAFTGKRGANPPGIHALLGPLRNPGQLIEVAGGSLNVASDGHPTPDQYTSFNGEQRVGVQASHYTLPDGRNEDDFTFVFQAKKNGVEGVYARDINYINGVLQEPLGDIIELVKLGDHIDQDSSGPTVQAFTLYRPLNEDRTIVFTANLSDSTTAILKASTTLQGIDAAGFGNQEWFKTVHVDFNKRIAVVVPWTGLGSPYPADKQYDDAKPSFGPNIAAYAVVNNNNQAPTRSLAAAPKGTDQGGALQIDKAFDKLNTATTRGRSVAFMAVDVENNVTTDFNKTITAKHPDGGPEVGLTESGEPKFEILPEISPTQAVARYADAVWAIWTRGVPALIYTNKKYWNDLTGGDSLEIQGIPLWDADYSAFPKESLGNFTPFGSWTVRIGRQYHGPIKLNSKEVDLDLFAHEVLALPRYNPGCKPAIHVSRPELKVTLVSGTSLVLTGTIRNGTGAYSEAAVYAGTYPPVCAALAARIVEATLIVPVNQNYTLVESLNLYSVTNPYRLNTIPVSGSRDFVINFLPPADQHVPIGTKVDVIIKLSCGGAGPITKSFANISVTGQP